MTRKTVNGSAEAYMCEAIEHLAKLNIDLKYEVRSMRDGVLSNYRIRQARLTANSIVSSLRMAEHCLDHQDDE